MAKLIQFLKKRKLLAAIFVTAIVVVAVICFDTEPKNDGPMYQGKPASFWLDRCWLYEAEQFYIPSLHTHTVSIEEYTNAKLALSSIGTNAIPYYLTLFGKHLNPFQQKIMENTHIPEWLPWLPALRRRWMTEEDDYSQKPAIAFAILGTEAIPALIPYTTNKDSNISGAAVEAVSIAIYYKTSNHKKSP